VNKTIPTRFENWLTELKLKVSKTGNKSNKSLSVHKYNRFVCQQVLYILLLDFKYTLFHFVLLFLLKCVNETKPDRFENLLQTNKNLLVHKPLDLCIKNFIIVCYRFSNLSDFILLTHFY